MAAPVCMRIQFFAELEAAKTEYKDAVEKGLAPSRNCEEEAEELTINLDPYD